MGTSLAVKLRKRLGLTMEEARDLLYEGRAVVRYEETGRDRTIKFKELIDEYSAKFGYDKPALVCCIGALYPDKKPTQQIDALLEDLYKIRGGEEIRWIKNVKEESN